MEEKYIKIIIDIVERYGKEVQIGQAIEEMAELTVELNKNINRKKDNRTEIILEIADGATMLAQLNLIYDVDSDELQGAIEYKLLRQKERMQNDKDIQCMTD